MVKELGRGHQLVTLAVAVACVLVLGGVAAGGQAPQVSSYQGAWQYRWGDSPRTPGGALQWALPDDDTPGWQPTTIPYGAPPGRSGQRFLWLRTRLVGPPLRDPALYLAGLDQLCEAYVDGRLVYHFGDFLGPGALRFAGNPSHFIALGDDYQGKWLALRIYSEHSLIGMLGVPKLGRSGDLVIAAFRQDLGRLWIGSLLAVLGLAVLALYLVRRDEHAYLDYGCFALCVGVYIVSVARVRGLLIDVPLVWPYVELLALYTLPIFLIAYLQRMFGRERLGIARWLWWLHILLLGQAVVRMLLGHQPYATLLPFQLAVLFDSVYLTLMVVDAARRGDRDARIALFGLGIAATLTVYDVFRAMGVLARDRQSTTHYGNAALTLSLGMISARRYAQLHTRLRNYATVLQLSLASARLLAPALQARVALDELLRMLGAQRALLFQRDEDGDRLALLAGRDDAGHDLGDACPFDAGIVELARTRRRPALAQRAGGDGADPASVMATPLLVRAQLLGVLYLEAHSNRRAFHEQDQEILLGLGNQIAGVLLTARAVRLEFERELTRRQLEQQGELLSAAARMAAGDLDTAIAVPATSELLPLARALDGMRRDLRAQVAALQARNQDVAQLNDELRRQIEQRSRRLLEVLLPKGGSLPAAAPLSPGFLLGDCYRVLRRIGQGGMGTVYEVERTTDGRHLAAKVLSANPDRTALGRFAREAQILARLNHPNLISICDIDVTGAGVLFIAMELIDGCSLWQLRSRFGQVGWGLAILRQIAAALAALHAQGIVHREQFVSSRKSVLSFQEPRLSSRWRWKRSSA